jgi:hypothetical protein
MSPIQVTGRINKSGQLELDEPLELPAGAARITIELLSDEEADIVDEANWDKAFSESQSALSALAAKVRQEYRAGKTVELDLDELERDSL